MSFPSSPIDLQRYTNTLGTVYQYDAVTTCWNIVTPGAGGGGANLVSATHVPVMSTDATAYIDSSITEAGGYLNIATPNNVGVHANSTILLACSSPTLGPDIGLNATGPQGVISLSAVGGSNLIQLSATSSTSDVRVFANRYLSLLSNFSASVATTGVGTAVSISASGGSNSIDIGATDVNSYISARASDYVSIASSGASSFVAVASSGAGSHINLTAAGGSNLIQLSATSSTSDINVMANRFLNLTSTDIVSVSSTGSGSQVQISATGGSNTIDILATAGNSDIHLSSSRSITLEASNAGTVSSTSLITTIGTTGANRISIALQGTTDTIGQYMNLSALGVSNSITILAGSAGAASGQITLDTGLGGADQIELRSSAIYILGPTEVEGAFSCNSETPQGKYVVGGAASTAGDVIILANNLRSMALAYGFAKTS